MNYTPKDVCFSDFRSGRKRIKDLRYLLPTTADGYFYPNHQQPGLFILAENTQLAARETARAMLPDSSIGRRHSLAGLPYLPFKAGLTFTVNKTTCYCLILRSLDRISFDKSLRNSWAPITHLDHLRSNLMEISVTTVATAKMIRIEAHNGKFQD